MVVVMGDRHMEFRCPPAINITFRRFAMGKFVRQDQLTKREKQILELVAHGLTNKAIARYFSIRESTVENHIHSVFEKLNISNRSQATAYAYRAGIISVEKTQIKGDT